MRVFQIEGQFGLAHLKPAERPDPTPGPGQVVVKLKAACLNYRDWLMVEGQYNPSQPLPLIPLSDGVGVVAAVGTGVGRVSAGQRVAGIFAQRWLAGKPNKEARASTLGSPLDGMLTEYALLDAEGVVPVPEHLSDEEAATLPCAAVTAWNALLGLGHVQPGDTVLLQGTGGVSIFALQFAKLAGARVIITSSSDEKLARAQALGADELINYRAQPDWDKAAVKLAGGAGVDHVVEVGGAGTFGKSLNAVRIGGTISMIGILSGSTTPTALTSILMKSVRVQGIFVGSRACFETMNRAVALHRLRPVVDRVFAFEDAPQAFRHLASGQHFGKVVIRF